MPSAAAPARGMDNEPTTSENAVSGSAVRALPRATRRREARRLLGFAFMAEQDKLRETLDELRSQLAELRQRDPQVAAHLEATIAEAKAALGGQSKQPAEQESITQRLSDAMLDYEASHPGLAGNLGAIIDALGRMGI